MTIEGNAPSPATKARAIEVAKRIPGVVQVKDGLEYIPGLGEESHVYS